MHFNSTVTKDISGQNSGIDRMRHVMQKLETYNGLEQYQIVW